MNKRKTDAVQKKQDVGVRGADMLGKVEITDQEFQQIVDFIKRHYGVNLEKKRTLIVGRMSNMLVKKGYSGYGEYMSKVLKNPFGEEATELVNTLTTNHTFFLREAQHFDFLREVVLPELKIKEAKSRDLGIWSAAASSGEEAYTIAMVVRDFFGMDAKNWDTTILATDVSRKALAKAEQAVFDAEQIAGLPKQWEKQYFTKREDGNYSLKKDIKDQVLFRYFNLMEDFPFKKKFHVVFLRNVMIYFDQDTKVRLLNKMYDAMAPGGYLFIGTTETIDRSQSKFQYVQPSVYRK